MDIYTLCAVVGGTVFLCQFLMSLCGFGHDHDLGGEHCETDHDSDSHGESGENHGWGHFGHSLFTFRALVVGITLFGLAGRAANENALGTGAVLAISVGAGLGGLIAVAMIMQVLHKLEAEGTLRIQQALGQQATVYLTIPARRSGPGKVTAVVNNRIVEFQAFTEGEALPTGSIVEVVDLLEDDMLLVSALPGMKVEDVTGNTKARTNVHRGEKNV